MIRPYPSTDNRELQEPAEMKYLLFRSLHPHVMSLVLGD